MVELRETFKAFKGIMETDMQGARVALFENQHVLGGSGDYFYIGKYEVKRGVVQGEGEVNFYGRKHSPIFRPLTKSWVRFSGKVQRRVMMIENHVVGDTKKKIFVRLCKRAELS